MGDDLYYHVTVHAGRASYDLSHDLASFTLDEEEGKPDALTLEVPDPYRVLGHALQEGMEIEVDLGTVRDHAVVFRGDIHQTEADFPQSGVANLTVQAYDRAMRMGLRERNRMWSGDDLNLSDIVAAIAPPHGFANVDVQIDGDPSFEGNGVRQRDETDLAFLLRLAREWSCQVYATPEEDHTLRFHSQRHVMTERERLTLYHGRCEPEHHLLSFEARSDVTEMSRPRTFAGMEFDSGEAIPPAEAGPEREADTRDTFADENLAELRAREPERAERLRTLLAAGEGSRDDFVKRFRKARRELTHSFLTRERRDVRRRNDYSTRALGMRGSGVTPGNMRMHAQTAVRIEDVGGRFSGTWFLSRVRHRVDGHGYLTEFDCRR